MSFQCSYYFYGWIVSCSKRASNPPLGRDRFCFIQSTAASWAGQITGTDESLAFTISSRITFRVIKRWWVVEADIFIYFLFHRWVAEENVGLTWVSLRGRSSAACCRGSRSWCKRHGCQRSRTRLCSAAPVPDRKWRGRCSRSYCMNLVKRSHIV